MKYLWSIIVIVLLTFSCKKKDEPVSSCNNGFLDPGEIGVDCGGSCDPCPVTFIPNLFVKVNGTPVTFENKTISELNGVWYMNFFNDTLQMQFEIGTNLAVGNYTLPQTNTFAVYNGINYSSNTNGNFGISENNAAASRLNGLFNAKFYQSGTTDTLNLTAGAFVDLPY